MPQMDGHEVCRRLKSNPVSSAIPVIFVTAKTADEDERVGFELGAVDYISKPVSVPVVRARVKTHLALFDQQRELERQVKLRTLQLEQTRLEVIHRLGRASELKDNETGMHVIRMSYLCKIYSRVNRCQYYLDDLLFNAAMHHIGKIGIADDILLKPGKLNKQEWLEMQRHVEYGAEILGNHHEKYDGSGYPQQLAAEDILLSARIVAIADVFDALTSARPYKIAWSVAQAMEDLEQQSSKNFDPQLVPAFKKCLDKITTIMSQYADENEEQVFGNRILKGKSFRRNGHFPPLNLVFYSFLAFFVIILSFSIEKYNCSPH